MLLFINRLSPFVTQQYDVDKALDSLRSLRLAAFTRLIAPHSNYIHSDTRREVELLLGTSRRQNSFALQQHKPRRRQHVSIAISRCSVAVAFSCSHCWS